MHPNIDQTLDNWFGPLEITQNHCLLFYYLSVFVFVIMAFSIGRYSLVLFDLSSKENWKVMLKLFLITLIMIASQYVVYYFYRIMYSMCLRTVVKKD